MMKLRNLLPAALLLAACQSMAVADPEHDEFFKALDAISPDAAATLQDLGAEYRKKCGADLTVEQYKELGRSSTAYTFRMVMNAMGSKDRQQWAPEAQERYQGYLREMECFPK